MLEVQFTGPLGVVNDLVRVVRVVVGDDQSMLVESIQCPETKPEYCQRVLVLPSSSVGEESLSPNHPDTSSRF